MADLQEAAVQRASRTAVDACTAQIGLELQGVVVQHHTMLLAVRLPLPRYIQESLANANVQRATAVHV